MSVKGATTVSNELVVNSSTTLLTGSSRMLVCDVLVPEVVNTDFEVVLNWTKNDLPVTNFTYLNISSPVLTNNGYCLYSELIFPLLFPSRDTSEYSCRVQVESLNNSLVKNSEIVNRYLQLTVQDPDLNLTVAPAEAVILSGGCPNQDNFINNISLVCTARKPTPVIPAMTLTLYLSKSVVTGAEVMENGNSQTLTYSVTAATVSDSGQYTCRAAIMIPDGTTILEEQNSIVSYRGEFRQYFLCFSNIFVLPEEARPKPVTNLSAVTTATSAIISWQVMSVSYTEEQYQVLYRVVDSTGPLLTSTSVSSGIIASDLPLTLTLRELQHNTTYLFMIMAINCIGDTNSSAQEFQTLQNGNSHTLTHYIYIACYIVFCSAYSSTSGMLQHHLLIQSCITDLEPHTTC